MHYYTFNVGDYRRDTAHLSRVEHGIYRDLIDWYYLEEKPIPIETESVSRRLRLDSDADKVALKNVLDDFFTLESDGYHHSRIDRDIEHYHSNAVKNRENGKKGGRPKTEKTQSVSSGLPVATESKAKQTLTNNQEPITINQEPVVKETRKRVSPPNDVDQQVWNDWIALRKAKRAPVTETVVQGARAEAAKAGMTLEAFLQVWCQRGSQGLQADWLKPYERNQAKSFAQKERELGWKRWEEMTGRQHPDRLAHEGRSQGQVIDVSGSNFLEIEQ
jgi:uncharacterized protein YdaU (DUF1376 family)